MYHKTQKTIYLEYYMHNSISYCKPYVLIIPQERDCGFVPTEWMKTTGCLTISFCLNR